MSTPSPIEILAEAAERGLTLGVKQPHTLTVQPANRCPKDFADVLTQHKPRLLVLLQLAFTIAYSDALGETIIFAENEDTKTALVAAGAEPFSIYTKDELRILVAQNRAKPFLPDELHKLHEAKRRFNGTVTP